jgi:hypothetical protein
VGAATEQGKIQVFPRTYRYEMAKRSFQGLDKFVGEGNPAGAKNLYLAKNFKPSNAKLPSKS